MVLGGVQCNAGFGQLLTQVFDIVDEPRQAAWIDATEVTNADYASFTLPMPSFANDSTLAIENGVCLTATIDILKAIAAGQGPNRAILAFALGCERFLQGFHIHAVYPFGSASWSNPLNLSRNSRSVMPEKATTLSRPPWPECTVTSSTLRSSHAASAIQRRGMAATTAVSLSFDPVL